MSHHATILAEQAATAVHDLAHLARPAITTLDVSELRVLAAALTELAAALPQVLVQLSSYLDTSPEPHTSDAQCDHDSATGLGHARACLRNAGAAAEHLAAALDAAHQTLGDIAETPQPQPRGSIFNRR